MATIMEKDVLLELVSYSLAMLHNKEDSADVSKNIRNLRIMKKNLINTEFDNNVVFFRNRLVYKLLCHAS